MVAPDKLRFEYNISVELLLIKFRKYLENKYFNIDDRYVHRKSGHKRILRFFLTLLQRILCCFVILIYFINYLLFFNWEKEINTRRFTKSPFFINE